MKKTRVPFFSAVRHGGRGSLEAEVGDVVDVPSLGRWGPWSLAARSGV
jgi:hypothetical protein